MEGQTSHAIRNDQVEYAGRVIVFRWLQRFSITRVTHMTQSRRNQIHSIDAKLYLYDMHSYPALLDELNDFLSEEVDEFNSMAEGMQDSGRGVESRDAQECLRRAIGVLKKIVDGKKRTQELLDTIHENLRAV